jgi:hypothetical protein
MSRQMYSAPIRRKQLFPSVLLVLLMASQTLAGDTTFTAPVASSSAGTIQEEAEKMRLRLRTMQDEQSKLNDKTYQGARRILNGDIAGADGADSVQVGRDANGTISISITGEKSPEEEPPSTSVTKPRESPDESYSTQVSLRRHELQKQYRGEQENIERIQKEVEAENVKRCFAMPSGDLRAQAMSSYAYTDCVVAKNSRVATLRAELVQSRQQIGTIGVRFQALRREVQKEYGGKLPDWWVDRIAP